MDVKPNIESKKKISVKTILIGFIFTVILFFRYIVFFSGYLIDIVGEKEIHIEYGEEYLDIGAT